MKTVWAVISMLVLIVPMWALPVVFERAPFASEGPPAWFTFTAWAAAVLLYGHVFYKIGRGKIGELSEVLDKNEYYKLLEVIHTPKGHLFVVMDRTGDIRTVLGNIRTAFSADDIDYTEGVWYLHKSFRGVGFITRTYLKRVKDDIAVATLEKGYRPQWAA